LVARDEKEIAESAYSALRTILERSANVNRNAGLAIWETNPTWYPSEKIGIFGRVGSKEIRGWVRE
jgi:hypothetical protein